MFLYRIILLEKSIMDLRQKSDTTPFNFCHGFSLYMQWITPRCWTQISSIQRGNPRPVYPT